MRITPNDPFIDGPSLHKEEDGQNLTWISFEFILRHLLNKEAGSEKINGNPFIHSFSFSGFCVR
jgi:hypothetical protein